VNLPRLPVPILLRILVFNLLVLFLPVASLLYLETYERQLLNALEHALVQQGRMLAAALEAGETELESGAIGILSALAGRHEARIRIVDAGGRLLADTSRLGPQLPENPAVNPRNGPDPDSRPEDSLLYRLSTIPFRLYRRYLKAPQPPLETAEFYSGSGILLGDEILAALEGRYGAVTRISLGGQPSVSLYSAIPVRRDGEIEGAVLVSQSTFRILTDLYELRLDILKVFLLSVVTAALLSLIASLTITRPLKRLSSAALVNLDPRSPTGEFPLQQRGDEIGTLARSLALAAGRIARHISFIESFAADVAHEVKNPVASIHAAAELALGMSGEADQEFFLRRILEETGRIVETVEGMRELSTLDARMEREEVGEVELGSLLTEAHRRWSGSFRHPVRLSLPQEPVGVFGSAARLEQAVTACVDNACSFSTDPGAVDVRLRKGDKTAVIEICDEGPGIPEENRQKVFERFFTHRPDRQASSLHRGLGLAIARTIVEVHGGTSRAGERPDGARGTMISLELPLKSGVRGFRARKMTEEP
jgi:two-component system, OmpR family, sensor histidine kinase ChvG